MTRRFSIVTYALVGMLALPALQANAADTVATQSDLDNAMAKTLGEDDAARRTITTLLRRADVQKIAEGRGLDMRRAEAAVGTLEGDELQKLSLLAAGAEAQLAGGDQVISISLVTLLLILIIVILVTR